MIGMFMLKMFWVEHRFHYVFAAYCLFMAASFPSYAESVHVDTALSSALSQIKQRSLSKRGAGIEQLAKLDSNPRAMIIMQAILEGDLYENKTDGTVVISNDQINPPVLAESGKALALNDNDQLKKIKINNRLRRRLRSLIAEQKLNSPDIQVRLAAVNTLIKKADEEAVVLLRNVAEKETESKIQEKLELFFALQDLNQSDKALQLKAIQFLEDKTSLEAVNQLDQIIKNHNPDTEDSVDKAIYKQAKVAVNSIRFRLKGYEVAETVFFGLSLGAVLALTAIGLAITFGVMGVINMAHGEMMMLGAYTTYVMQLLMPNHIGISILLAIPAAFIVSGLVGICIERGIIRFLYGRPLETLLATFGVSLVLQQTVRSIFTPLNRSVSTPEWMSGSWQYNEFFSLTWNRLYILLFSLLVFWILLLILKKTRLGLEVRAVSQNRNMAMAMGIPTNRVDAMTFGLGSGIAGVAGVALSQITNVGPNLGQSYIVDSFMVVVFGGVGNLWGTLLAGFSLGIANKILEPSVGAVLAKIIVLIFIILFIQKRPRGLFPQKGRAAEA